MQKLSYSLVFIITLLLAGCADAGQDKIVRPATTVVLDGNASSASVGGEIKKYKWQQISGIKVKISNNKNKTIRFTAPAVRTKKTLIFKLITTEMGGHPNKFVTYDCVKITVEPSNGTDITPPVITLKGDRNVTVAAHSDCYIETGATAVDDVDGNVDVNMTGILNRDTVGTYILTYTAKDSAGNIAREQRTITVTSDDVNDTNITVQSISYGSGSEGAIIIHEVNLSEVTTVQTVFDYKIKDETAMANVDFNATPSFSNDGITFDSNHSTITVPAGINNFEIRIETFYDFIFEVDETYTISLDDKPATGTILETVGSDTNTTVKSISDDVSDSVDTATYNVVMTGELNESKEYSFSITGETNITTPQPIFSNGVTYNAETETITVPAGVVDFSISVAVVEDVVHGKEKFTITIDGVSNHPWIEPIDPIIITSITSASVVEGGILTHNVTMSGASATDLEYDFRLEDTTTTAGTDYETTYTFTDGVVFANGKITVPAGVTSFDVKVTSLEDAIYECAGPETYSITVGNKTATGTIGGDECLSMIASVTSASVAEGDILTHKVTMSGASATDLEYDFNIANVTTADNDYGTPTFDNGVEYEATTGKVTVPAGVTSFDVNVTSLEDGIYEAIPETYNLTVGDKPATGTITDGGTPIFTGVTSASVKEGEVLTHTVTISLASTTAEEYNLILEDNTTTAGSDYETTYVFSNGVTYVNGKVTIPAGVTSFDINVTSLEDGVYEATPEVYNLTVGGKPATGTIVETVGGETNATVKSISDDVSGSVNTATYNIVMTGELNESKEYSFSITGENNITNPQPIFTNGVTYNTEAKTITVPAGIVDFSISVAVVEDVLHGKEKFTITIDGVSNHPGIEPIDPIIDTNSTQNENNNSGTFEKGQYGDINLTVDWSVPNGAVFIDIREDWERIEARPTGAVGGAIYGNQSFVDDVRKIVNNDTHKHIILICHSGSRTTGAAELLSNAGFSNVWQIVGGMMSWEELKPSEILTGPL